MKELLTYKQQAKGHTIEGRKPFVFGTAHITSDTVTPMPKHIGKRKKIVETESSLESDTDMSVASEATTHGDASYATVYDKLTTAIGEVEDMEIKCKLLVLLNQLGACRIREMSSTRPTFAEIVRQNVARPTAPQATAQARRADFPLLITVGDSEEKLDSTEFDKTKKKLLTNLKPEQNNLEVARIWPTYSGKIGMSFTNIESRNKVMAQLKDRKMKSEIPEKRGVDLVLLHSSEVEESDLTETLWTQNTCLHNNKPEDMKILKHKDNVTFIRTSPELAKIMIDKGRLAVNFELIKVEVRKSRPICFKCMTINHTSSRCKSTKPVCWRCGEEGHEGETCTKTKQKCIHCIRANQTREIINSHNGKETNKCPTIAKLWA